MLSRSTTLASKKKKRGPVANILQLDLQIFLDKRIGLCILILKGGILMIKVVIEKKCPQCGLTENFFESVSDVQMEWLRSHPVHPIHCGVWQLWTRQQGDRFVVSSG